MNDRENAISEIEKCLNWIQPVNPSHKYLEDALKSLNADLFGAAILYFAISIEAELCELMNKGIEDKSTEDLLKEAVGTSRISSDLRDEINGIMWLRDAHAHPQGTLNRKTWARLRTIQKEYGIPTILLSPKAGRWGYIIDFSSACLARRVAEKMNDLLAKMISNQVKP